MDQLELRVGALEESIRSKVSGQKFEAEKQNQRYHADDEERAREHLGQRIDQLEGLFSDLEVRLIRLETREALCPHTLITVEGTLCCDEDRGHDDSHYNKLMKAFWQNPGKKV